MYQYSLYVYLIYKIFGYKNIIETGICTHRCIRYLYRNLLHDTQRNNEIQNTDTKYLDWVLIYEDITR